MAQVANSRHYLVNTRGAGHQTHVYQFMALLVVTPLVRPFRYVYGFAINAFVNTSPMLTTINAALHLVAIRSTKK